MTNWSGWWETGVDPRPGWDRYFFGLAAAMISPETGRADCTRRRVAAIIVDERNLQVSQGYNGAPSGEPGCLSAGACPRGRHYKMRVPTVWRIRDEHVPSGGWADVCACGNPWPCLDSVAPGSDYGPGKGFCIAIHAEDNALRLAGELGISVINARMYVTCPPCTDCTALLVSARVSRVLWPSNPAIDQIAGSITLLGGATTL